jgi:hypothetical protein
MRRHVMPLVFAILVSSTPSVANAQEGLRISRERLFAANVLIGGTAGGLGSVVRGESFWRGFLNGSAGGAAMFAGKCLIAQQKPVTNWLGRASVAIGSSMAANAGAGKPLVSAVVVPLGPLRIYRDSKTRKTRIKLDLQQIAVGAYMERQARTSFDAALSAKTSALVFVDEIAPSAMEVAGVMKVWSRDNKETFAHELTHVSQGDFVATTMEDPVEDWLLVRVPGGRFVNRYFHIGIFTPLWAGLNELIETRERPWEKEAASVAVRC